MIDLVQYDDEKLVEEVINTEYYYDLMTSGQHIRLFWYDNILLIWQGLYLTDCALSRKKIKKYQPIKNSIVQLTNEVGYSHICQDLK